MYKSLSWRACADAEREVKLQFQQKLEQERAQWAQYRDGMEREVAELRRRLSEGQEEENLENEMKKVRFTYLCTFRDFTSVNCKRENAQPFLLNCDSNQSVCIVLVLGVLSKLGFVLF